MEPAPRRSWRVDVQSPRQLVFGIALLAVLAAVLGGVIAWDGWTARDAATALQNDGVAVVAEIVEVTAVSRTGEPLEAAVRLPDGRTADVDLSERPSNDGLKVGSKLQVVVQRDDISNNRPAEAPADLAWYAGALPLLGISVGSATVALITVRMMRGPRGGRMRRGAVG